MNKNLSGILLGLVFSALMIFSINEEYDLIQVFVGFFIFIFPAIFLSSFKSRSGSFLLTFIVLLFSYLCYRYQFVDTWPGVLMALTLGLPLYFLKVKNNK